MQAYNKSELENYFLAEEAKKLYQKKFLSKEQLQMIIAQLVQLKSNPNIFFRIGFFFLGSFLISTIISAFGLILFPLISEQYQNIYLEKVAYSLYLQFSSFQIVHFSHKTCLSQRISYKVASMLSQLVSI